MPLREAIIRTRAGRYHLVATEVGLSSSGTLARSSVKASEGCNIDDVVGVLEEVPSLPPDVASSALCARCFRPPETVEA